MCGLTGSSEPGVRGGGRGRHRAGDTVEGLAAAVPDPAGDADAAAVIGRRRGGEVLRAPRDDRDLVELLAAVIVEEPRGAGARGGAAGPAVAATPAAVRVVRAPGAAPAAATTTKRLHQSLGTGCHSTQVIQPRLLLLLLQITSHWLLLLNQTLQFYPSPRMYSFLRVTFFRNLFNTCHYKN